MSQVGVLQGFVLSPFLYSIYLDPLVDQLRETGPMMSLPFRPEVDINVFLCADDISSAISLVLLLQCVVIGPTVERLRLYVTDLSRKDSFNYLGVDIDHRGINTKAHANNRAEKTEKTFECLYSRFALSSS